MVAVVNHNRVEEEFLVQVADIAYQEVLRQGLSRPFLEVELGIWQQVRAAYQASRQPDAVTETD